MTEWMHLSILLPGFAVLWYCCLLGNGICLHRSVSTHSAWVKQNKKVGPVISYHKEEKMLGVLYLMSALPGKSAYGHTCFSISGAMSLPSWTWMIMSWHNWMTHKVLINDYHGKAPWSNSMFSTINLVLRFCMHNTAVKFATSTLQWPVMHSTTWQRLFLVCFTFNIAAF